MVFHFGVAVFVRVSTNMMNDGNLPIPSRIASGHIALGPNGPVPLDLSPNELADQNLNGPNFQRT